MSALQEPTKQSVDAWTLDDQVVSPGKIGPYSALREALQSLLKPLWYRLPTHVTMTRVFPVGEGAQVSLVEGHRYFASPVPVSEQPPASFQWNNVEPDKAQGVRTGVFGDTSFLGALGVAPSHGNRPGLGHRAGSGPMHTGCPPLLSTLRGGKVASAGTRHLCSWWWSANERGEKGTSCVL